MAMKILPSSEKFVSNHYNVSAWLQCTFVFIHGSNSRIKIIVSGKYIQPVQFRGANCRHTIKVLLIAIPDWVIQMSRLPWFCRCCQREIRKEDPTLTKHNFILEWLWETRRCWTHSWELTRATKINYAKSVFCRG